MALNQIFDTAKGVLGQAARTGRGAANTGIGLGKRLANRNPSPKAGMDDVTLARKVENEIFRDSNTLKGKIDVNAVDGTVWLRGEIKNPAQSKAVEAKVRSIPEVRDVENLLHQPKTPAPTRQKKAKATSQREKTTQPRRFEKVSSDDQTSKTTSAEPTPAEHAAEGSGRKPAPLGASDGPATSPTGGTAPGTGTGTDA